MQRNSLENQSPDYYIVRFEECPKCKKQEHYVFSQCGFKILENGDIIHKCDICSYEWKSLKNNGLEDKKKVDLYC